MRRYVYSARLVPLGQPVSIPDEHGEPSPYNFTDRSFAAEQTCPGNINVCLRHDRSQVIGTLAGLVTHNGWWHADFTLDPALRSELPVGQPVSVGLTILPVGSGDPILSEVSLVPSPVVEGACIASRLELKPAPIPAAVRTTTAHPTAAPHLGDGRIARRYGGQILGVR